MPSLDLGITIACPPRRVFTTVAHLGEFASAVPSITRASCLGATQEGVGARWEVFREISGVERSTVFEVVEYEPDSWVRIVSEAGGATWDAGFEVTPDGRRTALALSLEARAKGIAARMGLPVILSAAKGAFSKDLDAVKRHCESAK